jgi:HK97 family phage major capsid protein
MGQGVNMSKEKQIKIAKELEKLIGIAKGTVSPIIKASTGTGEDNTGANLTKPELMREILKSDFMSGSLYSRCNIFDVSDKANGLFVVRTKESSRTTANGILGGFIAYDLDEGTVETPSRPAVDQTTLYLRQKGIIVRVTNALLQDSLVLEQYLSKGLGETIKYYTDASILYGNGLNGCNGILDASGNQVTKYVACANPITIQNLKDMVKWYYGGANGVWVVGRDIYYEIINLYANTLPLTFGVDGQAYLFGYPIIRSTSVTARCLLLADLTQYVVAQKPIREDISEQLYFSSNETAFRTIYRLNGCPSWYTPITEESGQVTYPFVCCADQDTASSSSSSSSSYVELHSTSSATSVSSSSSSSSSSSHP